MRKKKIEELVYRILDKLFIERPDVDVARQIGNNTHLIENFRREIAEVHKATVDVLPTLVAIWNHPTFEPYRSKVKQ